MRNFTAVFIVVALVAQSFAWGPEGHRVIADVAKSRLSANACAQVRELLGSDDLAAIANWADEIKSERPATTGWHFVDIPRDAAGFGESRDCFHPDRRHRSSEEDHHNCVVDRIEIFQHILRQGFPSRATNRSPEISRAFCR